MTSSAILYIFDESSVGLHSRDVHRLKELLLELRDKGTSSIPSTRAQGGSG